MTRIGSRFCSHAVRPGAPLFALAVFLVLLLASIAAAPAVAAFPGANGPIVFNSNRDVGAGEIYSLFPGGSATRLTNSTTSSNPAYSPDGSKIAYVSANPGGSYQIFVMNADGSGRTPVTTSPTAKQDPTWSPDGRRIAFASNSFDVDGQTDFEIWTINADGTGARQLTNNSFSDTYPAWSPKGDRIAFVSARTGDTNRNVYVMGADGSGQTNLTPNSPTGCAPNCYQGHDDDPAWSPDGSRIVFVHGYDIGGGGLPNIWSMHPTGGNKTNLTNSTSVSFIQPAWSPQGNKLAAVGAIDTNRNIWVMNADGSGQVPIETNAAHEINPDWGSPPPPDPPVYSAKINKVSVSGPAKVKKNKKATYKVKIRNSGNATAAGVRLKVRGRGVSFKTSVGKIGAGRARTVKVKLKPRKPGKVKITFKVTSKNAGGKTVRKKITVKK